MCLCVRVFISTYLCSSPCVLWVLRHTPRHAFQEKLHQPCYVTDLLGAAIRCDSPHLSNVQHVSLDVHQSSCGGCTESHQILPGQRTEAEARSHCVIPYWGRATANGANFSSPCTQHTFTSTAADASGAVRRFFAGEHASLAIAVLQILPRSKPMHL